MQNILSSTLFVAVILCLAACGDNDEPDGTQDPIACDPVSGSDDQCPTGFTCSQFGGEAPHFCQETEYYAVLLQDRWDGRCEGSTSGAHGADIDAIAAYFAELGSTDTPELVAYATSARVSRSPDASSCGPRAFDHEDALVGPPNASDSDDFYSLAGGWAIIEFEYQILILDGYQITIFEHDVAGDDGADSYDVYFATELDCITNAGDTSACQLVPMTGEDGVTGETTVFVTDLAAF